MVFQTFREPIIEKEGRAPGEPVQSMDLETDTFVRKGSGMFEPTNGNDKEQRLINDAEQVYLYPQVLRQSGAWIPRATLPGSNETQ